MIQVLQPNPLLCSTIVKLTNNLIRKGNLQLNLIHLKRVETEASPPPQSIFGIKGRMNEITLVDCILVLLEQAHNGTPVAA